MMEFLHSHAFTVGIDTITAFFILGFVAYFHRLYRHSR